MVDLFPAIRLAQSILKRKFPFVDKPLKKGLWKIWAPGLISRILRYVGWSLWLLVGPLMPNRSKDDQTKCGPLVLRGGGDWGGGSGWGLIPYPTKPCYYRNQKQTKFTLSREHCRLSSQEVKTAAANRDKWRVSVKALWGMYHKAQRG